MTVSAIAFVAVGTVFPPISRTVTTGCGANSVPGVVLLGLVLVLNVAAIVLRNRFERKRQA